MCVWCCVALLLHLLCRSALDATCPPPPLVQDKPAGGAEGGAANYIVTAPGTYRLKNGKLTQLA